MNDLFYSSWGVAWYMDTFCGQMQLGSLALCVVSRWVVLGCRHETSLGCTR